MKVATDVFHTKFYYISICGPTPYVVCVLHTNLRDCPLRRGRTRTHIKLLLYNLYARIRLHNPV